MVIFQFLPISSLFLFIDLCKVLFDIVHGSLQLLALESIFGDSVFVLDRRNGLRSFQVL